ncbi:tRNA (N6-threonylcarbamoyladenosine(37)-N6)-methyltransferase TrmO [Lyngbya confervoides]|uniref:tRNA (N6-threonylcarbamoyladenosine(37)-N6)-methyltransferase TrmO n=1 Tax=Lyngbya confervoides BDU141951 TaxID=1574623 RepID=A0ABD4T2E4_9CYAN|nr:tRNA (N6-threonylcarbamoyladenosine(37)-N6)-methyltransferase TrmO [Lyngbya confervoides]MCM1982801.1 tRNA (N6-threonylcarbamoyladenosine(37)-N6)-methyltransferase TrmO [Lyngbya confervoides BDU141951]
MQVDPIAYIRSCYPDRFGIPRQAGLVPMAEAEIVFAATEENKLALRGLEEFSHVWVLFWFHQQRYRQWKPLVKPPRLGGKVGVGVYATRSPNRPNPLGMSVVRLVGLSLRPQEIVLEIRGGDFLDQTPVIDLKPYVAYADRIEAAQSAWATPPAPAMAVQWRPEALAQLQRCGRWGYLQALIEATVGQDPRPAYERGKDGTPGQQWHMQIATVEIAWMVEQGQATIVDLHPAPGSEATVE